MNEEEKFRELNHPSENAFTSRELLWMSVGSFLVYAVLAWIITGIFHEEGVGALFEHGFTWPAQLIIGIAAGVPAAAAIIFLTERPPLSKVLNDFAIFRIISQSRFSVFDRIQISLFAGVGEELLFRGAIQPLIGIWLTSFIFIGIHGYFKFRSPGHWLFGSLMFGLGVLLGFLFDYSGLMAAMWAHAVYDGVMLWWVVPTLREANGRKIDGGRKAGGVGSSKKAD